MAKSLYTPGGDIRHVNLKLDTKLHKRAWDAAKKLNPPQTLQKYIADSIIRRLVEEGGLKMAGGKEIWHPIATAPEGVAVMTKIDDGNGLRNEQPLTRRGNLWWTDAPSAMYVYYQPTHWRPL